jgi:hypothetical protein
MAHSGSPEKDFSAVGTKWNSLEHRKKMLRPPEWQRAAAVVATGRPEN